MSSALMGLSYAYMAVPLPANHAARVGPKANLGRQQRHHQQKCQLILACVDLITSAAEDVNHRRRG